VLERHLVLPHLLAERARSTPDRLAMVDVAGRQCTYADLQHSCLTWAGALRRLDVQAGEPVLTMLPNSFECYEVWLGVAWLRAIEVPANNMYRGDMLRYVIDNSTARVVVISVRYLDRLAEVIADLPGVEVVVVPDADDADLADLGVRVLGRQGFFDGVAPADDLEGPGYHDIMAMIYTSGTTGPSKGVLVPWAELYEFVRVTPEGMVPEGGAYYTVYPGFHVSGKSSLYLAARYHAHIVIRESFSLTEFWSDIRAHDVKAAGLIGPLAAMLLLPPRQPDDADTPLERVYMGPLVPQLDEFRERFGVQVGTGFGMTEIGAPIASNGFDLANSTSCGRLRTGPPHYEARVVDELDEPVPPGTVGELVVRARDPWVLNVGYWRMPDKTAAAWRNGWFHTGDAFRCDEDGNFYFVDRLKDAIRRRGENVSSFEVEAGVNQHPAVAESAAVGVPSALGEEEIKVVVVPRPGEQLDPQELVEFLIPRMPRFMIPRYVEIAESLPKTDATFRTRKVELREDLINERTWDRESHGVAFPKE
jgi:crotonobetaine/carnitine-CoA ligase